MGTNFVVINDDIEQSQMEKDVTKLKTGIQLKNTNSFSTAKGTNKL